MSTNISDWTSVYVFPMGRLEFALTGVHARAATEELTSIMEPCQAGIAQAQQAQNLSRQQRGQNSRARYSPKLQSLDNRSDLLVGALVRALRDGERIFAGQALAKDAQTLHQGGFPGGVRAITHLSWPEQHAAVGDVLRFLKQEKFAEANKALGIAHLVHALEEVHQAFGHELQQERADTVSADQVRAARALAQHHLEVTIVRILSRFPGQDRQDSKARAHLLAPIIDQQEALASFYRSRRPILDVNPSDGTPLSDDPGSPEVTP